jgi:hypothetical protein
MPIQLAQATPFTGVSYQLKAEGNELNPGN